MQWSSIPHPTPQGYSLTSQRAIWSHVAHASFSFPADISTCLIQTFGFHTQERTDQVQDPGKIVFIAHLIRFSLFSAKLVRIYFR